MDLYQLLKEYDAAEPRSGELYQTPGRMRPGWDDGAKALRHTAFIEGIVQVIQTWDLRIYDLKLPDGIGPVYPLHQQFSIASMVLELRMPSGCNTREWISMADLIPPTKSELCRAIGNLYWAIRDNPSEDAQVSDRRIFAAGCVKWRPLVSATHKHLRSSLGDIVEEHVACRLRMILA